jgi:CheY-like chemotaxis protein
MVASERSNKRMAAHPARERTTAAARKPAKPPAEANAHCRRHAPPKIAGMAARHPLATLLAACLADGMDNYVTQPIRVDALVDALNLVQAREGEH